MHDNNSLLVSRREDVMWFYFQEKKQTETLRVRLRSGKVVAVEMETGDRQLLERLAYALPAAIQRYGARWFSAPKPALAQEVDRRRSVLQ